MIDPNNPTGISFEKEVDPDSLIGFDTPVSAKLLPEDMTNRAYKFDIAFGDSSPGLDEIGARLNDGREDLLRTSLVANENMKAAEQTKQLVLDNLAAGNLEKDPTLGPAMVQANAKPRSKADEATALERGYVYTASDYINASSENDDIAQLESDKPMDYGSIVDPLEIIAVKREVINSIAEEQKARMKDQSWGAWGEDILKQALEFPSWWNLVRDGPKSMETASWLPGSNVLERIEYLRGLSPEALKVQLKETIDRLNSVNLRDGQDFLDAMQSYSVGDSVFRNVFAVSAIPVGAIAKSAIKTGVKATTKVGVKDILQGGPKSLLNRLKAAQEAALKGSAGTPEAQAKTAAETITQAITTPGIKPHEALASSGLVEDATRIILDARSTRKGLVDTLMGDAPDALKMQLDTLLQKTASFANPRLIVTGSEDLAGLRANMLNTLTERAMRLLRGTTSVTRVATVPEEAQRTAMAMAERAYRNYSSEVEQTIMNVRQVAPEQTPINTGYLEITHGDKEKLPFSSRGSAINAALNMGMKPGTFTIDQVGKAFTIKTYKAVDESLNGVIDDTVTLNNTPRNNSWLAWPKIFLSSKTSVSKFQAGQRATASHGDTAFEAQFREFFKPLQNLAGALNGRSRATLDKVMHVNRITERVPGDPNTRGMFYKTRDELDEAYMNATGRFATDKEAEVYAAFVQASDLDWIYRSWNTLKVKARKGFEEVTVSRMAGKNPANFSFEGKVVDDFSVLNTTDDIDVAYINPNGEVEVHNMRTLPESQRQVFKDLAKEGNVKLLKTFDPRASSLQKLTASETPVTHILTSRVEGRAPLQLDKQVNYKPGFHNEYKADWYLKQPKVKGGRYNGDVTALASMSEKKMHKMAAVWEKGRQLLLAGDQTAFNKFVADNLDMTPERFKKLFDEHLDINVPFTVVKRGSRSIDSGTLLANGKRFESLGPVNHDMDRWHNPSNEFGDAFTANRDPLLFEGENVGTDDNPLWGIKEAEQFSPMFTQTNSLAELAKATLYDDLQLTTASNYVEAFKGKLIYDGVAVPENKLRANPIFYLTNAEVDWKNNPLAAIQAWQLRTHAKNLLGQPSALAKPIEYFKQRLIDGLYTAGGETGLKYIPEKLIPAITDPFQYARAVAFHSKLGMFNITQYFVQASAINNMVMISPVHGPMSWTASALMAPLELTANPKIIEHFGEIAEKMGLGWNKAKFVESKNWMDSFAFDRVGGEYSFRSTSGSPTIYRGTTGHIFLDKGPMFFNAGERTVRLTGWNTAYLEWASKNPGRVGKMTRDEAQTVLDRAQVFTANMTRDANSFWQQGLAGNFTQFWSYNIRMGELMIGKQLSWAEKTRLVMGNMLMYGFTPAAGIAASIQTGDIGYAANSVNPWAEDLRVYAAKKGYDMDNDLAGKLYDGMLSVGLNALTGAHVGVGNRYGLSPIQVFDTIKENFRDHSPAYATLISIMGPSGNIMSDIISEAMPIARDLRDFVSGENVPKEILEQDIITAFREITGVSNNYKIYSILQGLNWRSQAGNLSIKNDTDLNKIIEVIKTVTGVTNVTDLDAFNMLKDSQMLDKDRNAVRAQAKKYIAQYYDLVARNDPISAKVFFDKARILVSGEYMTTANKMEILFPKDQAQTPASEKLFRDWFGKLTPEEQMNVDNLRKQRTQE